MNDSMNPFCSLLCTFGKGAHVGSRWEITGSRSGDLRVFVCLLAAAGRDIQRASLSPLISAANELLTVDLCHGASVLMLVSHCLCTGCLFEHHVLTLTHGLKAAFLKVDTRAADTGVILGVLSLGTK